MVQTEGFIGKSRYIYTYSVAQFCLFGDFSIREESALFHRKGYYIVFQTHMVIDKLQRSYCSVQCTQVGFEQYTVHDPARETQAVNIPAPVRPYVTSHLVCETRQITLRKTFQYVSVRIVRESKRHLHLSPLKNPNMSTQQQPKSSALRPTSPPPLYPAGSYHSPNQP